MNLYEYNQGWYWMAGTIKFVFVIGTMCGKPQTIGEEINPTGRIMVFSWVENLKYQLWAEKEGYSDLKCCKKAF